VEEILIQQVQLKATEQYFIVVLFVMLLTFESVHEVLSVIIQIKATEQYFPAVLFINYAVQGVLTFESVDEILNSGHSDEWQ